MKKYILGLITACAIATPTFADINPWQECGIGAMIFPENGAAAAVSNIVWDLGTTAISTNISSPENCQGSAKVAAAKFITETYTAIEDETVKGQGEHLTSMLNILGCDNSSHGVIISDVRNSFSDIVSSEEYLTQDKMTKAKNYYNVVQKSTASCVII